MRLIDVDKLNFHCNYDGDCSGDISHCKECDKYVLDYRDIQEQSTFFDMKAKPIDNFVDPFKAKVGDNS